MEPHTGTVYLVMIAGSSDYHLHDTRMRAQRDPACSRLLWIRGPIVSSRSISQAIPSRSSLWGLVHLELMKEEQFQSQTLQFSTASHRPLGVQAPSWVALPPRPRECWSNPSLHCTPSIYDGLWGKESILKYSAQDGTDMLRLRSKMPAERTGGEGKKNWCE